MSASPSHRPSRRAPGLADGEGGISRAFTLIAGHAMPVLRRFEVALPGLLPHWRQYASTSPESAARAARIADMVVELAAQQRSLIAGHPALCALALRHAEVGPREPLAALGHEPLADSPETEVNALVPLVLNPCYRIGLLMASPAAWHGVQGEVASGVLPDAIEPWHRLRDLHCHLLGCGIDEAETSFVDLAHRLLGESAPAAPAAAATGQ